ncbi:MAG: hypothetical protein HUU01_19220 [Saprospiraceae bacterium]|nr:hypothetical protein [Saprospiraceae bacterium]
MYRQCNECSNTGLDANDDTQTFTYGASTDYLVELVADDYGPRQNGTDIYDWHGGIDYNSANQSADMGDLILAIHGGTIEGTLVQNYKRLIVQTTNGVQNFGYGHFFVTGGGNNTLPDRSGGCWLMLMTNGSRCIVTVINGTVTAKGPLPGSVIFNGQTYTVSNTIAQGEPIGPTGYSGLTGGAHLHLFSEPDNETSVADNDTKNPLQYVDYTAATYDIQLRKVTNYNNNITESWNGTSYPGSIASPIVVRPVMENEDNNANRYNTLNDINRVELLIKKQYESTYKLIKGITHESDIRVGGRIGETILPDYMYDGALPEIGDLTRQGIRPFAYATFGAHRYDDYYFPNFTPRLHQDTDLPPGTLSYCPMSSRYNDGRYQLKARITDVRNNATDGPVQEFVIDNYKPFIQEVKVNLPNVTEPFYQRYWVCNDNTDCKGMYLTTPGATNNEVALAQIRNGIWINVTASEPLANLTLDIADSNIQDVQAYESFEDGRKWQFVINSQQMSTILGKQSIEFLFYGYDWNNPANHLINLKTADGAQTCVKIPKREDADSWEQDRTTGPDELHFFNPKCGQHGRSSVTEEEPVVVIIPDESCFNYGQGITREVTAASNESASDGAITLHVEGGIEPYRYEWWNGNTTNQATGLAPGNYCVRVYDALCCETQVCIEVPACQKAKLSAQITKTCEGQQNCRRIRVKGFC